MDATRAIHFTVPGRINGKQRAGRKFLGGNNIRTFTPAKTASHEAIVRQIAALAMRGRPLFAGPVALNIVVTRQPPVSWSQKKRAGTAWITSKPDWDNIGKLISDALNGIAWLDDAQVAVANVNKMYSVTEPEQVHVTIAELV